MPFNAAPALQLSLQALPALLKWGLAERQQAVGGAAADPLLTAVPLPEALRRLDAVWDGVFDFRAQTRHIMQQATAAAGTAASAIDDAPVDNDDGAVPAPAVFGGAALGHMARVRQPMVAAVSAPAGSGGAATVDGAGQRKGVRGMFRRIGRAFA